MPEEQPGDIRRPAGCYQVASSLQPGVLFVEGSAWKIA